MYKTLILKYIHLLTPEHVKNYAISNNISVTNEEVIIIYKFIRENYQELLDSDAVLVKLKPHIREELYQTIQKLYKENKAKYLT